MKKETFQKEIELNLDFTKSVYLQGQKQVFTPTPMLGVERMMFERRGGEKVKRATSCVTYSANSHFSRHNHPGGEEYFVLSGTFSDETGHYPQHWYVRNPVDSSHTPFSDDGCEIFVKLAQLPPNEKGIQIDTATAKWQQCSTIEATLSLWSSRYEITTLHRLTPSPTLLQWQFAEPTEIFLIQGEIKIEDKYYQARSWLRIPANTPFKFKVCDTCTLYRKIGLGYDRK